MIDETGAKREKKHQESGTGFVHVGCHSFPRNASGAPSFSVLTTEQKQLLHPFTEREPANGLFLPRYEANATFAATTDRTPFVVFTWSVP